MTNRYIDEGLFSNLYKGSKQTAHLFFEIDSDDANPLLVLAPNVQGGVWFKTVIPETELGENRIVASDWEEAADKIAGNEEDFHDSENTKLTIPAPEGNYAGALDSPLRVGDWAFYQSGGFGESYSAEFRVDKLWRGSEAEELWHYFSRHDGDTLELGVDKELLAIRMDINVLEYYSSYSDAFNSFEYDVTLVNNTKGTEYEKDYTLDISGIGPGTVYPPGHDNFYVFWEVEKEDINPLLKIGNREKTLWYSLDEDATLSKDIDLYEPIYEPSMAQDAAAPKGNIRHPYDQGETASVNYQDSYNESSFTGDITVMNAVRGEAAKQYISEFSSQFESDSSDLVVVELKLNVKNAAPGDMAQLDGRSFSVVTDEKVSGHISSFMVSSLKEGALTTVLSGHEITGFIAFRVPKDIESFSISYGNEITENSVWLNVSSYETDDSV